MSNTIVDPLTTTPSAGLSESERVLDTFIAPSKTFHDLLRSAAWWVPFVLMILGSVSVAYTVDRQVGFQRVTEIQMHQSPAREEQINKLPPDQKAQALARGAAVTKYTTYYGVPVILIIFFAVYALILWGSFNFGLGAQTSYKQVFALTFYAALPYLIRSLLTIVTLALGSNTDSFDQQNPVGTNPGYYLTDVAPWLHTLLSRFDLIDVWSLVLIVLGMSILARKSLAQSATVVVGLWCLMTVLLVGLKAVF